MKLFKRFGLERTLRWLHSWLGAIILPWIVLAGLTGFYMNHEKMVLAMFPSSDLGAPSDYIGSAIQNPVLDVASAFILAGRMTEATEVRRRSTETYHDRTVWIIDTGPDEVIIDRETGFMWIRARYSTTSFAPDGQKIGHEWRWSKILTSIHARGWVGDSFGRFLADATAIALVVFGLSGIVLFYAPRLRRRKNRRVRLKTLCP